jgi:hypothetical protein
MSDENLIHKFNKTIQDSLDKAMLGDFQTTAKLRPLTPLEVAYKIRRDNNHWLVISLYNAVGFARKMRGCGFKLQRVKSGHWLVLDTQNHDLICAEIDITRFLEKDQCYIINKPNMESLWQKQREEQMAKMFESLKPKDILYRDTSWYWRKS